LLSLVDSGKPNLSQVKFTSLENLAKSLIVVLFLLEVHKFSEFQAMQAKFYELFLSDYELLFIGVDIGEH
jgi:hypothetical protein